MADRARDPVLRRESEPPVCRADLATRAQPGSWTPLTPTELTLSHSRRPPTYRAAAPSPPVPRFPWRPGEDVVPILRVGKVVGDRGRPATDPPNPKEAVRSWPRISTGWFLPSYWGAAPKALFGSDAHNALSIWPVNHDRYPRPRTRSGGGALDAAIVDFPPAGRRAQLAEPSAHSKSRGARRPSLTSSGQVVVGSRPCCSRWMQDLGLLR